MSLEAKDPAAHELVPWRRVVAFNRQVSHDVRNVLNAVDLEAAFIAELNSDPEIAEELKKLRAMVVNLTKTLHEVSSYMGTFSMNPIELEASLLLRELRERLAKLHPKGMAEVAWNESLGTESVRVDVECISQALREIFENAFQFQEKGRPIAFTCRCEGARHLLLELREGKSSPVPTEEWGTPLFTTRRGGYGLGLFHASRVIAAHGGELKAVYDPGASALVTRVSLPLTLPPAR